MDLDDMLNIVGQRIDEEQSKKTIYELIQDAQSKSEVFDYRSDPRWVHPTFKALYEPNRLHSVHLKSLADLKSPTSTRLMYEDMTRLAAGTQKPIFLWGPPGARKTRTIEAFRFDKDENGVPFQVIVAQPSTDDPTVIHGIRYTTLDNRGRTVMNRSIPDIIAQIKDYWDNCGGLTIMLIDEITTCSIAQQNAMLGYLTHGEFAGVVIKDICATIVAGNPENTVSTALPLTEAVMNRGCHIPWYGDLKLFIDDWTSGWRGATTPPDIKTQEIITSWLEEGGDRAFRHDTWSPDNLVPYELMTHSERATTDLSEIITVINTVYENAPISIRHHLIIEFTRAYVGNEWADRMVRALRKESTEINPSALKSKVTRAINKYGNPEFFEHVKDGLQDITVKRNGRDSIEQCPVDMFSSVCTSIVQDMEDAAQKQNYVKVGNLVPVVWAFISTRDDTGDLASVTTQILKTYRLAGEAVKKKTMTKSQAIPPWLSTATRELIRNKLAAAKNS